jgi:hypothetical protein
LFTGLGIATLFRMPDSYTVLWNKDRVRIAEQQGLEGRTLEALFGGPHISQPSFMRAGVQPGDHLYVIAVSKCVLHVMLRFTVTRMVPVGRFIAENPHLFPPGRQTLELYVQSHPEMKALIWTCTDEVVQGHSTPLVLSQLLPIACLERLHFRSRRGERPVKGVQDGRLTTAVSFQGVYRLAEQSARDFEETVVGAAPG